MIWFNVFHMESSNDIQIRILAEVNLANTCNEIVSFYQQHKSTCCDEIFCLSKFALKYFIVKNYKTEELFISALCFEHSKSHDAVKLKPSLKLLPLNSIK